MIAITSCCTNVNNSEKSLKHNYTLFRKMQVDLNLNLNIIHLIYLVESWLLGISALRNSSIVGYYFPYSYHIKLSRVLNAFQPILIGQTVSVRIRQLEEFSDGYTNDDNSDNMTLHPN